MIYVKRTPKIDYVARNQIIFGKHRGLNITYQDGGIEYFAISIHKFKKLIDEKFITILNQRFNGAPSVNTLYKFCKEHADKFYVAGFVVNPERTEYRGTDYLCLTGLYSSRLDITKQDIEDIHTFIDKESDGPLDIYDETVGHVCVNWD